MADRRRVAVVTGGGGGIGTAVALDLARRGVAVVAMDPGVGVQGEPLNEQSAERTVRLIAGEGGVARACLASVTDADAVRSLFGEVAAEFGGLDIVVNTAGILRFAPFLDAAQDDWRAVLDVHLNGYLNVLAAALPLMAAAGRGQVVGVTSGAGLARAAADSAPYSCAKRAVAAVTWQLARLLPPGLALNALSPLAATRMVTGGRPVDQAGRPVDQAGRVDQGSRPGAGAGVDLSAMPAARDMAPAAAYLAGELGGDTCRGQVIFSAGPELSVIAPPRLIEAVRTGDTTDFAASLDTLVPVVLGPAEAQQRPTGGANARFGPVFDVPGTAGPAADPAKAPRNCLVVTDDQALAGALRPALARCGLTAVFADLPGRAGPADGFTAADRTVAQVAAAGGLDAIIIAPRSATAAAPPATWQSMLAGFGATADDVRCHAGWLRAAAALAVRTGRPLRVVHLADAASPASRPAAQAIAQLSRCASLARPDLVQVFAVALEGPGPDGLAPVAELAARLVWSGDVGALRGAELFARPGWIGLRSHPGPAATASYGTTDLPAWIGDWLREAVPPGAG